MKSMVWSKEEGGEVEHVLTDDVEARQWRVEIGPYINIPQCRPRIYPHLIILLSTAIGILDFLNYVRLDNNSVCEY